jgi:hypothetical protein
VKQLARDMIFTPTGTLDYPAAADDYAFTVTSEARWQLSTGESYLTLGETTEQPATASVPYKFTLESNVDSYAPRVAPVVVTSSDPDFYPDPRTFYIRQAGTKPFIDITDPASLTHSFGTAPTMKTVTFSTNAKWKFITSTGYADVIASADVAENTVSGAATMPTVPVTGSVTFTPSTSNAGWGGSTKSTDVTFSTAVGIGGVAEETEEVTLTRVVPAEFLITGEDPADGSTVAATAFDVTVTANTNLKWWVLRLGSGVKDETGVPSTYSTGVTRTVNIPARPTRNADSWTTNGPTITVQAGYDAQNDAMANNPASYTYTQLPYTLGVEAPESSYGASVTLTVTTNAPEYWIILKESDGTGTQLYSSGWTTGESKTVLLEQVNGTRRVDVVNGLTGTVLTTFNQPGNAKVSHVVLVQVTNPIGSIDGVIVNLTCPDGYVKKWNGNDNFAGPWEMNQEGTLAQGYMKTVGVSPSDGDGLHYYQYGDMTFTNGYYGSNYSYAGRGWHENGTGGTFWTLCYK